MSDKVEELKGLLERATPAPWKSKGMGGDSYVLSMSHRWNRPCYWDEKYYPIALPRVFKDQPDKPAQVDYGSAGFAHDDAALIVWLVNNAPALIDSQAKEIAELREALKPFAEPHAMGDAYVQFSPQLVRQARAALQTQAGGE